MPKPSELIDLPRKIEGRGEYLRAEGYVVTVETVYRKRRLVRALSAEQARDFALSREAEYAPKYFGNQKHADFEVRDIDVVSVEKATTEEDGTA